MPLLADNGSGNNGGSNNGGTNNGNGNGNNGGSNNGGTNNGNGNSNNGGSNNGNSYQPSTPAGKINQGIFDIIHQIMTDVDEDEANTVNIYAYDNTIIVENATDEIRVYNAMGALVCRDVACRVRAEITVNGTSVYIVKTGNTVKRVFVNKIALNH